jgi:hypothetical protein
MVTHEKKAHLTESGIALTTKKELALEHLFITQEMPVTQVNCHQTQNPNQRSLKVED